MVAVASTPDNEDDGTMDESFVGRLWDSIPIIPRQERGNSHSIEWDDTEDQQGQGEPFPTTPSTPFSLRRRTSRRVTIHSRRKTLFVDDFEADEALMLTTDSTNARRESVAKIRPTFDCPPMEKAQRRNARCTHYFGQIVSFLCRQRDPPKSDTLQSMEEEEPPASNHVIHSAHGNQAEQLNQQQSIGASKMSIFEGKGSDNNFSVNLDSTRSKTKRRETPQIRLSTYNPSRNSLAVIGIGGRKSAILYDDDDLNGKTCSCFGFEPNTCVVHYLHWAFRQPFWAVILSAAFGFFAISLFFAFFIVWSGRAYPDCVSVNGDPFSNNTTNFRPFFRDFGDAFALSWTSFSTVGYGVVSPSSSAVVPDQLQCTSIILLSSFEAFVGILFGSLCGAILYGKVARVRSFAQIIFSDIMVVRYGVGAMLEEDAADISSDDQSGADCSINFDDAVINKLPCPVLEFRIANRMHDVTRGGIMDCTMNIVASIDGSRARSLLPKGVERRGRRSAKDRRINKTTRLSLVDRRNSTTTLEPGQQKEALANIAVRLREQSSHSDLPFEEDALGKIKSKTVFAILRLETPHHPYFKRVWTARHTLDLDSPILADDAKEAIRLNYGYWPKELNDAQSVRASLNVDQILISFSGTSNADANSVYAQKVYDFQSVKIGYSFVNMMYRDDDDDGRKSGKLQVDMTVMNDLVEQDGGGGEPLVDAFGRIIGDMFIL